MLADYALGANQGGYTSEQKKQINDAGKLFTYSGIGKDKTTTTAKTSSGTGSAVGSSSGGGGTDLAAMYASILAQQQAARQAAYDAAAAAQKQNYDYNVSQVNKAADKALQEAYINKMNAARTMQQNLSAQGLGGGMSETTQASLLNNYENSRNNTENSRSDNLTSLGNTYQNNMAQLRAQLMSGQAADLAQYTTNLMNLAATNGISPTSMDQASVSNPTNNLYYQYLQQLLNSQTV